MLAIPSASDGSADGSHAHTCARAHTRTHAHTHTHTRAHTRRALCSKLENFSALRRGDGAGQAVELLNPATAEFEVCRTTLLPAALKTLGSNKDAPLPVKLFECSDVILIDGSQEVRTMARACGAFAHTLFCTRCDATRFTPQHRTQSHTVTHTHAQYTPQAGTRSERRLVAVAVRTHMRIPEH